MLINKLWYFLFSRHHNKYIISIDVFDIYSYPILMFKFVVTGFCLFFNGWSRATTQKIPGVLHKRTRSLPGWINYFIDLWQCCMFMTYLVVDPPLFLIQVCHSTTLRTTISLLANILFLCSYTRTPWNQPCHRWAAMYQPALLGCQYPPSHSVIHK